MSDIDQVRVADVTGASEFLVQISSIGKPYKGEWLWRGVGSDSYDLVPSVFRKQEQERVRRLSQMKMHPTKLDRYGNHLICEHRILKDFWRSSNKEGLPIPSVGGLLGSDSPVMQVQTADADTWPEPEVLPAMALAQHYGLPTRLLDWSHSHFIAAYMAASSAFKKIYSCWQADKSCMDGKLENLFTNEQFAVWMLSGTALALSPGANLELVNVQYAKNPNIKMQRGCFSLWRDDPLTRALDTDRTSQIEHLRLQGIADGLDYLRIFQACRAPYSVAIELLSVLSHYNYSASSIYSGYDGIVRGMEEDSKFVEFERNAAAQAVLRCLP